MATQDDNNPDTNLRAKSLEWFLPKTEIEKEKLKEKYFAAEYIPHSSHWGYHFLFSQIEEMYTKEHR